MPPHNCFQWMQINRNNVTICHLTRGKCSDMYFICCCSSIWKKYEKRNLLNMIYNLLLALGFHSLVHNGFIALHFFSLLRCWCSSSTSNNNRNFEWKKWMKCNPFTDSMEISLYFVMKNKYLPQFSFHRLLTSNLMKTMLQIIQILHIIVQPTNDDLRISFLYIFFIVFYTMHRNNCKLAFLYSAIANWQLSYCTNVNWHF